MSFTREIEMNSRTRKADSTDHRDSTCTDAKRGIGGCRNKGTGGIPQKPWLRLHSGILFLQTVEKDEFFGKTGSEFLEIVHKTNINL